MNEDWISPLEILETVRRRPLALLAVAFLGAFFALTWASTQTPVYRASATILVDNSMPQGGLLGKLAEMTQTDGPGAVLGILRSGTLAGMVVQPPSDGRLGIPGHPEYTRRLGLTTIVEDTSYSPLATFLRRMARMEVSEGRVFAALDRIEPGAPRVLEVEFIEQDRIRIRVPGSGQSAVEMSFEPEKPLHLLGVDLRLATIGDVHGRTFAIQSLIPEAAQRRVASSLSIDQDEKNPGVIQLHVDDSDPHRAADIANALAENFLVLNAERGERRASKTIDLIQKQLDRETDALEQAERELVRLQEEDPTSIDIDAATHSLIDQLKEFEIAKKRVVVLEGVVRDVVGEMHAGNSSALSRLSHEIDDQVSLTFVKQIADLMAERQLITRRDGGGYKELLTRRVMDSEKTESELRRMYTFLADLIESLKSGDMAALARVHSEHNPSALILSDPLTSVLLNHIGEQQTEMVKLGQDLKPEHPQMATLAVTVKILEEQVLTQLESRLTYVAKSLEYQEQILQTQRALIDEHESDEISKLDAAITSFAGFALEHLEARLAGLANESQVIDAQIAAIEEELARLPEAQRRLAGPLRRFETHKEVVTFLLKSQREAEISQASSGYSADVIDPAPTPFQRLKPRTTLDMLLGALLGSAAGLGLLLMHQRAHGALASAAALADATGLVVLAAIPDERNRERDAFLALRDQPDGVEAEAIRGLRAKLRTPRHDGGRIRSLTIASCQPASGRTMLVANLALAIARGGERVLLLEADLRTPRLAEVLELPQGRGLVQILRENVPWRACARPILDTRLHVIPAGALEERADDLISTEQFDALLEDLSFSYDVILVDLPNIDEYSDLQTLGHRLDAAILFYRRDGAKRSRVQDALLDLEECGVPLAGCVLAGAPAPRRTRRWRAARSRKAV